MNYGERRNSSGESVLLAGRMVHANLELDPLSPLYHGPQHPQGEYSHLYPFVPSYWADLGANRSPPVKSKKWYVGKVCIEVTNFIYNLWLSAVTACSLVARFFYVYFVRYPFKDLCYCGGDEEWRYVIVWIY